MVLETALISVAFASLGYTHILGGVVVFSENSNHFIKEVDHKATQLAGRILFTLGTIVAGVMLGLIAFSPLAAYLIPSILNPGVLSTLKLIGFASIPISLVLRSLGNALALNSSSYHEFSFRDFLMF